MTHDHDAFGTTWTLSLTSNLDTSDLLRYGFPPCPLRQITDVYIRTPDHGRGKVTLSRVEYSGGFYFRTRPYIVSDSERGSVWSRFEDSDRYVDNGDLSRDWEHSWAKMTDAARKLVKAEFAPVVEKMLSDEAAVLDYWHRNLSTFATYRRDEAQHVLDVANQVSVLAQTIGATVPRLTITEESA